MGCLFTDFLSFFVKTHSQVAILTTKQKAAFRFLMVTFWRPNEATVWGDTAIFCSIATNVQYFSIMQFICTSCEDTRVYTYQCHEMYPSTSISQSLMNRMASNTGMENIQAIFASMPGQCQAVQDHQRRNSGRPTRAKSGIQMGTRHVCPCELLKSKHLDYSEGKKKDLND